MKWIMILALWNTNPPQESFKFYTQTFASETACEEAIQDAYAAAFNRGVQAQAVCVSQSSLNLGSSYY